MKKDNKVKEAQVIKMKEPKVKSSINKETLTIVILISLVILLTVGIVVYYFYFAENEAVVTYDGGKITKNEYEMYYKMFAPWLSYYGYSNDKIATYIAEKVVLDKIIYAKAIEKEFKLDEEEKKTIDEMFKNEDDLSSIEEQGIDVEQLKEMYYKDAVISLYVEDLKAKATQDEIKEYIVKEEGKDCDLNVYDTSHILLKFEDEMKDEDKAKLLVKAKKLLDKAKAGNDFAKLAKDNSDDSSSSDGGKVAIKNNNTVYAEYRDAVLKTKKGQIYNSIVETAAGYHIIKLNSIKKNGRLTDADDVAAYVDTLLYKMQEESNYKINEEKINKISYKIAITLGLNVGDETVEQEQ